MRKSRRRLVSRPIAVLLSFAFAAPAFANGNGATKGVIHKVTDKGESYEDLAEHYYGRRYLALHLRLFNRRAEPLARGITILIPTFSAVPIKRGQTLEQFAEANLMDATRADYLAELHGLRGKDRASPKPGTKLRVVPSLKHLVRPGESLRMIARLYYREASAERVKLLALYNNVPNQNVKPGMSLRIPLDEPEFNYATVAARARRPFDRTPTPAVAELDRPRERTPAAPPRRKRVRPAPAQPAAQQAQEEEEEPEGDASEAKPVGVAEPKEHKLEDQLEELDRLCGDAEYAACEANARQLFDGSPSAPLATKVEVLRLRAVALIALNRLDEGKDTFKKLLALDPEYDLDLYRTSPKILDVFQAVAER